jgi:ribonucleoside-diphosphate reductase alpha chain
MGQLGVDLSVKLPETEQGQKPKREGVSFPRYFTAKLPPGRTPYDECRWEIRTASIANDKGVVMFEQRDVEVPADWSQTATNIVASKYFHGRLGSDERETSAAQLVHRVVDTTVKWGKDGSYFKTDADAENFRQELAHLVLTQKASFNSPVWFNVGVSEARGYGWCYEETTDAVRKLMAGESRPQCSACFINSVRDSLESILIWPRPRACCSSGARARARTCLPCARKRPGFRAAAVLPAR